jgi:PelA/Pel-15E family pectate lyase
MHRRTLLTCLAALPLTAPIAARAAQIGVNTPFPPLSPERIRALIPAPEQAAWLDYLKRSQAQLAADQAALLAERKGLSVIPAEPTSGNGEKTMPLDKPAAWYASAEGRKVADNIVSFQTPAGGWGKNQPHDTEPRVRGQHYVAGNSLQTKPVGDFDAPTLPDWSYVGTIDNDATLTETRFLALAFNATQDARYRDGAIRGLTYLLTAQFPNGGWPQVWPLMGGYHDALTLNDNAMISVSRLMGDVGRAEAGFAFVPAEVRARCLAAEQRALAIFLKAQVVIDGKLTLWAQQYDALTLTPCSARNYEMPSLSSAESGSLLVYLMQQPNPSVEMKAAIVAGVETLDALKIMGKGFERTPDGQDRRLVDRPGAGPIWSRYYDLKTLKPIFGNRTKTLHDTIDDVEPERRRGYSWFGNGPQTALKAYVAWKAKFG